jgi:hypothetical protein|tara:strand:+ start:4480 stop:4905 length:426 start_codon:yes stop_codon:yes gene_type:complete
MRPLYETKSDLNREFNCVERLMSAWNCNARKLPISYQLDYLFERNNKPSGWCEIKCRNHTSTTYPTLILSYAKIERGIQFSERTGLPFIVVASMQDGDFWYLHNDNDQLPMRWGGRTKNVRDNQDSEPVVHIPMGLFKRVA